MLTISKLVFSAERSKSENDSTEGIGPSISGPLFRARKHSFTGAPQSAESTVECSRRSGSGTKMFMPWETAGYAKVEE